MPIVLYRGMGGYVQHFLHFSLKQVYFM